MDTRAVDSFIYNVMHCIFVVLVHVDITYMQQEMYEAIVLRYSEKCLFLNAQFLDKIIMK